MALRDLPAFRRTQKIIPTPTFLPKAGDELANVFSGIAKASSEKVRQIGIQKAATTGAEAGEIVGAAQPRSNITDADRAFNRAWVSAQTGAIQLDVRDTLQKIQREVSTPGNLNTNSQIEYQERAKGYLEGLVKNVAPEMQQQTLNYFKYYNGKNSNIVDTHVTELHKNQLTTKFFEYRNKSTRDIQQAAFDAPFTGDIENSKAGALYGQLAQRTHEAVLSGLITPKMGEDILSNSLQQAQQENYLGQFDAVLRSDDPTIAKKWLQGFEKSAQTDLVPQEKRNLLVKMIKLQKEHENLQVTNRINLTQDKKNAIAMIEHGATEDDILPTIERVNRFDTSDKQQKFAGELQAAILQKNISDTLRLTPPTQVPATLEQFRLDKDDPFFAQKADILDKVEEQQNKFIKELLDDPAAYALSTPTVQKTIQERSVSSFDTGINGVHKPQPSDSPISNDVDQQMLTVQRHMEVPEEKLSLLPKKSLEAFSNKIAQLSFPDQIREIEAQLDAHDKSVQNIVLRDLNKAGVAPAHSLVLAASYSRNPEITRDVSSMIQAFSEDKQELRKSITSGEDVKNLPELIAQNNDEYHATLKNYRAPTEQTISQLLADQEHYALFLMSRKGLSKDEAARRAAQPINGAFHFEELKGSTYRIPRWTQTTPNMEPVHTDVRSVKSQADLLVVNAQENEDILVPDEYMVGVREELAKINYMKDLQAGATIMTTPGNQGIAVVDAYGNIVRTNSGITFQSTFPDIQANTVSINREHAEKFGSSVLSRELLRSSFEGQFSTDSLARDALRSALESAFGDE